MNDDAQPKRKGRPPTGAKHRHVMLPDETVARAKVIGGGNISLGIRLAVHDYREHGIDTNAVLSLNRSKT